MKDGLAIGGWSCGNNAPFCRGRVVNSVIARACKARGRPPRMIVQFAAPPEGHHRCDSNLAGSISNSPWMSFLLVVRALIAKLLPKAPFFVDIVARPPPSYGRGLTLLYTFGL